MYDVYKIATKTKKSNIFRSFVVQNDEYALTYQLGHQITSESPIFVYYKDFNTALTYVATDSDAVVLAGTTTQQPVQLKLPFGLNIYSTLPKEIVRAFWRDEKTLSTDELKRIYAPYLYNFVTQSYVVYDFTPLRVLV